MTRTKKTQPKKKKKLFSQKGSQKGSNKMSAKVKSNKKSLNSKATAFVTPVSLATSAKPAAKPLSAKLRSAKGLSPKGTSVKHKVSPKSTSNKKETVNQFTNDEGGGGGGGQVSTTDDQPALKNAYRKMYENRFSQQRIPACTPLLTVGSAIPFFALITVAFAAIGCIMWQLNSYAVEYTFDYTDCVNHLTHKPCQLEVSQFWSPVNGSSTTTTTTKTTTTTTTKIPSSSTSSPNNNSNHHHHNNDTTVPHCHCHLFITLNHSIPWNVFIYYRIESLFQSYLPYSESIDEVQLNGHLNGSEEVCGAYFTRLNGTNTPIAPCGMIANSLFNDSIALYKIVEHPGRDHKYLLEVPLFSTGITWTPKYAVKNPPVMHSCPAGVSKLQCAFNGTASPPNWHRHIWELDPEDAENNGYKNERLLSWMRFAPFGVFRKLYGRVDHQQVKTVRNAYAAQYYFGKTLSNGTYLLNISYNYPVAGFGGRKAIIISNTTWMGGKSPFLAYLFIITSIVCLFILIIFYFIDRKFGKLSDEVYSFVRDKSTQRQRQADSDLLERVKKHSAK